MLIVLNPVICRVLPTEYPDFLIKILANPSDNLLPNGITADSIAKSKFSELLAVSPSTSAGGIPSNPATSPIKTFFKDQKSVI